jgi:hypothetical protein
MPHISATEYGLSGHVNGWGQAGDQLHYKRLFAILEGRNLANRPDMQNSTNVLVHARGELSKHCHSLRAWKKNPRRLKLT